MGLMDFKTDVELKGEIWKYVLDKLVGLQGSNESFKIFSTYYEVFLLSTAIGIMYDERKKIESSEKPLFVPRNVLISSAHRGEIESLLTTAIISSNTLNYTIDERLMIAFGEKETSFKSSKFLEEFANYGVDLIYDIITNHDLETMENLKDKLNYLVQHDLIENLEIELDSIDN